MLPGFPYLQKTWNFLRASLVLEINEMSRSQGQNDFVALVTGANGITGAYLVAQMAKEPHWKRIIATSRRPPFNLPKDPRVEFAQADLSGGKESSLYPI